MKSLNLPRLVLCLFSWLAVRPAAAQMHDRELAAPRLKATLVAIEAENRPAAPAPVSSEEGRRLLHELTNTLQLQPYQIIVLRRALAVCLATSEASAPIAEDPATDATAWTATPSQELWMLLTEAQLARLQQWEGKLPGTQRLNLVASAQ